MSFTHVPTGSRPCTRAIGRGEQAPVGLGRDERLGRLLVEAVLVEVAHEQFRHPSQVLVDGLQGELPQQVFLQALGLVGHAFEECAARLARLLGGLPGVALVGAVVEEVRTVAVTAPSPLQVFERLRRAVLLDRQGGVLLQLLLDGGFQVLQGQGHEAHRLDELGSHLELLDLAELRSLGLHLPQWCRQRHAFVNARGMPRYGRSRSAESMGSRHAAWGCHPGDGPDCHGAER